MRDTAKVYTPEQVAEILQLKIRTVMELLRRGICAASKQVGFGELRRATCRNLSSATVPECRRHRIAGSDAADE
jgi:hypothetical protein